MNRPIKFRVWSNLENRYLPSYADKGLLFYTNYGRLDGPKYSVGLDWFISAEECEYPVNYRVQLFTGIKDKNGREIYEADIVEVFRCGAIIFRSKVTFEIGCFGVVNSRISPNLFTNLSYYEQLRVIGNVFENPKLLAL